MAEDFFDDLDRAIAEWTQMALLGQDIERVARLLEKSESLVYQFTYPGRPQKPSFKQFIKILRGSPEKQRVIKEFCRAFGMVALPNGSAAQMIKALAEQVEE